MGHRATSNRNALAQKSPTKRRVFIYRVLLSIGALLFGLLLAEGALRILEKSQLGDRRIEDSLVADPVLGHKLAPFTRGHDSNGFRNDSVPQHADVVTLGDSQTWGVNAERQDAWPQQLAKISGHSVYNMGLGGYGPVQYKFLIPQALRLSPKIIVVGLYLGNDIYDAYHMAYQYEAHRELRNPSAGDLSANTVGAKADAFWNEEKKFHSTFGRDSISGWSFWLREHLALGRLLNRTHLWPGSQDIDYEIDKRWAGTHPESGAICDWPAQETVFTTAYRLAGLDLDEPRVAEGLRISTALLAQMKLDAEASHTKLLVLLLPTKETVYAHAQRGKLRLDPVYQKLVEMEARVRAKIILECQDKSILCVDVQPQLTAALDRGERLYPTTTESHPNARGYFVIASVAKENLGQLD